MNKLMCDYFREKSKKGNGSSEDHLTKLRQMALETQSKRKFELSSEKENGGISDNSKYDREDGEPPKKRRKTDSPRGE